MNWRSFVLVSTAILLVCAIGGISVQANDIALNDNTATSYIYKPDSTEAYYAIASFFVTYYDSIRGKPISSFGDPEDVGFANADDEGYRSAVDGQGNIHIVWMTTHWGSGGNWEIAYVKFDSLGNLLVGPIEVSDLGDSASAPPQYNSAYPAIAIDSNDDAHIVWMDERDGNWEIYYSKVSHTGVDLTIPDVCISDKDGWNSGRYVEPDSEWETVAGFQQGTGNPIVVVHTAFIEHPDMCVDGDDRVHIVWSDHRDGLWQAYYQSQTVDGSVIVDDKRVSAPSGAYDCISPAIAAGPFVEEISDYTVRVIWQENNTYYNKMLLYWQKMHASTGQFEGGVLQVRSPGDPGQDMASPDIAVDDSDFVHIAYMDNSSIDPGHGDASHPAQRDIHIDGQWEIYVATYNPALQTFSRVPKRESDLTATADTTEWGDPLYGEYTGPGSPTNLHDCPSMYPRISVAEGGQNGWTSVTWQDYRNQNWDIYYVALGNLANCPHADIQLTTDPRPDKYPCISGENAPTPDIAFQRKVDLGYGLEWEGYHCRWNGETEYVRATVSDSTTGELVGDYYLFQMDPTDTNAFDGVDYMWTMPLPPGTYRYQFRASIDAGATEVFTTPQYVVVPPMIHTGRGVDTPPILPLQFSLEQNYPNPFNAATALNYTIPQVTGERFKVKGGPNTYNLTPVILKVYNILGEEVRTLVDGEQSAGSYQVVWDGKDNGGNLVASGVYLCRLKVQGDRLKVAKTRKMVLLR